MNLPPAGPACHAVVSVGAQKSVEDDADASKKICPVY